MLKELYPFRILFSIIFVFLILMASYQKILSYYENTDRRYNAPFHFYHV